ncbi:MAG TPA: hypothetical protein VF131_09045 [Blastocatellia bacterium]|nr:hypothetical protein [Blastocatellia bacterium]
MRILLPTPLGKKESRFRPSHLIAATVMSVILPAAVATHAHAQGFGFKRTKATLTYKWPARVYLTNATFAVKVSSQAKLVASHAVEQMGEFLESQVRSINPGLKPVSDAPETFINCTILDAETSSGWEYRTTSEYQATGTHTVTNPETGAIETVTDYGYVNVNYQVQVITGRMSVEYWIKDARSGLLLDQDKLTPAYRQEFKDGLGAPGIDWIVSTMTQQAVWEIAQRLTPRSEDIKVVLPKGKLAQASNLFKKGLWDQSLALLEAMPALKKPKDDAYRLYGLALAYEATAFTTHDPVMIRKRLERAVELYRTATRLNPGEENFWEPRNRAELGSYVYGLRIIQARKFEECGNKLAAQSVTGKAADCLSLAEEVRKEATPLPVLNNEAVIKLVRQATEEEYLLASIKHTRAKQFDLSASGRADLAQAGVNDRVIKAMQRSQVQRSNRGRALSIISLAALIWPYALLVF